MKKILALLLMVVMSFALLTGCGSDPVYDDLENFLNVEMKEVTENYTKSTAQKLSINSRTVYWEKSNAKNYQRHSKRSAFGVSDDMMIARNNLPKLQYSRNN